MNQKAREVLMTTAIDYFLTDLKDTEPLPQQELLASLLEQLEGLSQSMQSHTVDVILQMGQDGSISLSLTVRHKH